MALTIVVKKQSWKRFAIKVAAFWLVIGLIALFFTRFHFSIDEQVDRCLPDHFFYLVDRGDKKIERGNLYAFKGYGLEPIFRDGQGMLKKLVGLPGDEVQINALEQVIINNEVIATGLAAADKLDRPVEQFMGSAKLAANQYWFTGESERSFDSRYWGTVSNEQIIGRAYPLF